MDEKVKGKKAASDRQARLAAALRDNLRRRKEQERGRRRSESDVDAMISPPGERNPPRKD